MLVDKINRYINAQCVAKVTEQLMYITCEHEWYGTDHTYRCKKCGYIAGYNSILLDYFKKKKIKKSK